MTSLRPVTFAVVAAALIGASGCRTAGMGNLTPPRPAPLARLGRAPPSFWSSTTATPSASRAWRRCPRSRPRTGGAPGCLHGKLALELPRNFKLELGMPISGQTVADIGSNDQEFWFWAKDTPEKAVYYCNYDESGASPLAAAGIQPDWIIEALGLRVITDDEAARIKVTPGKDPGTVTLTQKQKTPQGEEVIKETVLNETTGRIREHWVYSGDRKTPLAHAVVTDYQEYPVPNETGPPTEKVYLPKKLRLEWIQQEKMTLDVTLNKVKVNPKFNPSRRHAALRRADVLRLRPDQPGADQMASTSADAPRRRPSARRSPRPPPRVRLERADPARPRTARVRRPRRDPADLSDDQIRGPYAAASRRSSAPRSPRSPTARAAVHRGAFRLAARFPGGRAGTVETPKTVSTRKRCQEPFRIFAETVPDTVFGRLRGVSSRLRCSAVRRSC